MGTGATCHLGCSVTPLGLKSPPPQDWVSSTNCTSPSKMCRQQKGRRKNYMENVLLEFKQCFCWLTLFISAVNDTAVPAWYRSTRRPAYPSRQTASAEGPPATGHQRGRLGNFSTFCDAGVYSKPDNEKVESHAPGRKVIACRSHRGIFPHSDTWAVLVNSLSTAVCLLSISDVEW